MTTRRRTLPFIQLDVFTDRALTGNQLAVFPDARDLDTTTMQLIAREMSFSESTFVFPSESDGALARVRIFTPDRELPFAGHPVIGTTFALAANRTIAPGRSEIVFELKAGPTPVTLEWSARRLSFAWMTQRLPEFGPVLHARDEVAAALGIEPSLINTALPIQVVSCGLPFLLVALRDREAVDAAVFDARVMRGVYESAGLEPRPVLVFAPEADGDVVAYSRRFGFALLEDAATGGAAGPLGCYLLRYGVVTMERARQMVNVQGVKMGRPSRLYIRVAGAADSITGVQVGGTSVVVGDGRLRL